uniref:hypothetical protein n=1 Tax=Thaumasiovibrio occultus TaxID=1891184 RepID=UPI0018644EEC|nr:hypothetical protein [Thaumasiovibrio occultus]
MKSKDLVSTESIETVLIDGVYVSERRRGEDRRKSKTKYLGFERRTNSQRREKRQIDKFV